MARFLLTGGCGFIGSHLADALLARGDHIVILDDLSTGKMAYRPGQTDLVIGDVGNGAIVSELMREVDGCFHLAAIASVERTNRDWPSGHRVNLGGTVAVLDAARRVRPHDPVPVVYASSAAVYGRNPGVPLRETMIAAPISAYGADKLGCELHARAGGIVHRIPTLGLRFFNVYGPRQDPRSPYSGVISIFQDRVRRGQAIEVFGDGHQRRDFVYVKDVVAALLAAMEKVSTVAPIVNVCTGRATSLGELIVAIGAVAGAMPEIRYSQARAGDIRISVGDARRLRELLGVTPSMTLENALYEWKTVDVVGTARALWHSLGAGKHIDVRTASSA